jgi:hypothetical protein
VRGDAVATLVACAMASLSASVTYENANYSLA